LQVFRRFFARRKRAPDFSVAAVADGKGTVALTALPGKVVLVELVAAASARLSNDGRSE
jgi:hypothetical protein